MTVSSQWSTSGENVELESVSPDLQNLVRAASQLQEQVRSAVQRLEQSTYTVTTPPETLSPSASGEQGTSQGRQRPDTQRETENRSLAVGQTLT